MLRDLIYNICYNIISFFDYLLKIYFADKNNIKLNRVYKYKDYNDNPFKELFVQPLEIKNNFVRYRWLPVGRIQNESKPIGEFLAFYELASINDYDPVELGIITKGGLDEMKKKLQNKLHKGKFREWGVHITVTASNKDFDIFLNEFIDYADKNEYIIGGDGWDSKSYDCYIVFNYRGQNKTIPKNCIDELKEWLNHCSHVLSFKIGKLVNPWDDSYENDLEKINLHLMDPDLTLIQGG